MPEEKKHIMCDKGVGYVVAGSTKERWLYGDPFI